MSLVVLLELLKIKNGCCRSFKRAIRLECFRKSGSRFSEKKHDKIKTEGFRKSGNRLSDKKHDNAKT
jgi:hypothetical protein